MNEFIYIVEHLLYTLLIVALFWSLGKIITKGIKIDRHISTHFDAFVSILVGMTIVIIYLSILSIIGIAYKPLIYLLGLGFWGIKYFNYNKKFYLNIGILLIIFIPILCLTLYPPTHWDDISFHLPIAQSLLELGNLSGNIYLRYPYFPFNAEMLFTFGMIFNVKTAQLISSISLFTLCIGLYGYVNAKTKSNYFGFLGFLIVFSSPLIVFLSSVSYVDMLLATFITAGIILQIEYFENKNMNYLYLSGVFMGVAAGIKYTALIVCVISGIIFLVAMYKNKIKIKNLLIYISIVTIVGIPWYVRTLIYTGNPVWPFMSNIFGIGSIWNENDYTGQFIDFEANGVEKTLSNLINIPQMLADNTNGHMAISLIVWLGFIMFLLMKKTKEQMFLLLYVAMYTISWFLSVNLVRYYAIIIPTVLIICTLGFSHFIQQMNEKRIKIALYLLLAVAVITPSFEYIKKHIEYNDFPPLTYRQNEEYLARKLPTYEGTLISSKLNGKTYSLLNENLYYYSNGKAIGDWFGVGRYASILGVLDSEKDIYMHLKTLGADYFLINKLRLSEDQNLLLNYNEYFKKIYEDYATILFELY